MLRRNGHSRLVALTPAPSVKEDAKLIGLACGGAVIIFAIDAVVPLGVAVPMAYVALVLIGLRSDHRWFTASFAGAGIFLTAIGCFLSPPGDATLALINRGLAIVVIAVTACLILLTQHARQELRTLRRFLSRCASCRKIKDERGEWGGLEQFLEQRTDLVFSHAMCPLCMEKWYPELYPELQVRHPELFESQPN